MLHNFFENLKDYRGMYLFCRYKPCFKRRTKKNCQEVIDPVSPLLTAFIMVLPKVNRIL